MASPDHLARPENQGNPDRKARQAKMAKVRVVGTTKIECSKFFQIKQPAREHRGHLVARDCLDLPETGARQANPAMLVSRAKR